MPGTTRYSATFDRTYEEEAKASSPPNARRSRSQSWQANSGHDGRQYTPFASRSPAPRSSSTDNNLGNGTEFIPTRTAKTSVKAHNNPFQFVKVGTCPLYKKAEEQLKKAKETKKPDVLKEEEEEWQTNLDSWKSRRRKMSEDVFRRQEELKLLELEEQIAQVSNKKTKTFSEMVESRATRGRALSLCLLTSPLEFQNWEFENKAHKSGSCSYTDESGENSIVNSEDEGVSVRGRHEEISISENAMNHRTNGDAHIEQNGTALDKQNGNCNKLSNNVQMKTKENSYIDSGLESISSSHRAGDTPDSGSDFSQDSNSSIDCDSPRTGVNVLEEFGSKSSQISEGHEIRIILKLDEKGQDFGFTFLGGKDEGQVIIASILEGSKAESSGMHLGDRIITIDGCDVSSKKHIEIAALIQKGREKNQMNLLLWRHTKTTNGTNGFIAEAKNNKVITDENFNAKSYEKSIESENEMFVDDFEELKRQSDLLANKKSVAANALANGNKLSNKDAICLKTSSESSTAPIPKINASNSAVEEPDKNEEKAEINNENQKKNIIKVKRVRRKGVYALNVDSNQISQDGNCTNTLFPLSPVTELPSPADESKTMSSTLSSNITLPVSNSQNGFSDEGKQKNAESIKSNIPVSKENNSGIPTSGNTENSKSATLQTDSKNVENQIKLNTENKTEIANSSTLSSNNKDSQDEKSKSQPTIKKIKPSKLKKGMSSENTSAASECTKELTNAAQRGDVTTKTAIQEKSSSESNSSHSLENKQLATKNDVKNLATSDAMENNISSKNIPVKPATEIVSVPTKKPSNTVSNGIGVQTPKVVANNVKAPTTNIRPKILTSENTSAASECTKELTNAAQLGDATTKTAIQEKSSSESNSSHSFKNKQLATKNDVKNLATLETLENNTSSKNVPVKPATEIVSVPTKTPSNAVSNGIGVQSPKVVANNVKAPTASIRPKMLTSKNTSAASECTKELTNAAQCDGVTTKTAIQEKSSSESKSSHSLEDKKLAIKNDIKNLATLQTMENNISSKNIPVKPATEISVPTNTPSNAVSNGIGVQSPKVVTNTNVKVPTTSVQPKISTSEDSKPKKNIQKKVILKSKANTTEKTSCGTSANSALNEIYSTKEQNSSIVQKQEKMDSKKEIAVSPLKEESNISLNGIANVSQEMKLSPKEETSIPCPSTNKVRDLTLKFGVKKPSVSSESSSPTKNAKALKSPLNEKTKHEVVEKKESTKAKENCVEQNLISSPVALSSVSNSFDSSSKIMTVPNKNKPIKIAIKDEIVVDSSKMSANSQKVNTPAKLNEESKISNDSLNVVFQSQPKNMGSENITNNKNFENNNSRTAISTDLVTDVPPVDKIAEEMEKLILEQLEEEERAKELSTGKVLVESSPEHLLTAPPRLAEPPKEKPPPPPSTESPKDSSLKRVNSTKRIKKEIHKRRSNFLGIENADESICSESSVPPPPALEEILKAEMELDRQSRLRIENESTERLTLEEKEIMQKEREIIESLESEERRKMYLNGTEECNNVYMSSSTSDAVCEQGHIESLKSERKRIDTELQLSEEQQQILIEEKQLKEREEFIRQQEASISTVPLSDSSLSVSANTANNLKKPALSSVPTEVQSNGLLLGTNGDGSGLALSSSTEVSMNETSKGGKKIKASEKPAVPPKPLKKKEAIRKERERLRQEQEALQREREEHRRKLMLEQEELMKQQKTHAPDAPASRLGPHPPQIQPSFPPQLTTTMNATPNARENASFPSRSHHGTSNTAAGSLNTVELMGPPVVRQNIRPAPRKAAQNEAWGQQKMPSVRKQNHESLPESRYNQNHWLIQEAEMRRIAELKERQRTTQTPCTQTHLAEDDVCSNPPRVPVISPTHNPHLIYPVQEKVWNYGQPNMPLKKYPPPVVKEPPLHTIYPRETVPQQPPTKPSRVVPSERQEQMLSVSGRKRCSHCNEELGRGAAMIIESLQLYYHIHCFQCCVCQAQLGNGSCGTDVRVRNNKLHCHNCYSNDEAGLKFSQV